MLTGPVACFRAGATETAGFRRGMNVHCSAWYRSDLPGHTVPMTWLSLSSWWNQEPCSWSMRYSSMYRQNVAYQSLYSCLSVTVASTAEVFTARPCSSSQKCAL